MVVQAQKVTNLQGSDFREQNLTGRDFSNTDIRGAKFSNAILTSANFHNAKTGLSIYWTIYLFILSLMMSLLAGLISGYSGALISNLLNDNFNVPSLLGKISLITLGAFLIVIFWQGIGTTLAILAEITGACLNVDPREVGKKIKTLDLFHYEGIDPTAAAIAITQLAQSHPTANLELVALEGRGQDKIRLQAVVSNNASPSELYKEYFQRYTKIKSLPYNDLQAILLGIAEKDERISSLEKLLSDAIQQPKFYAQTYQSQGDFIMSKREENISKGNISISGAQGNISGIAATGENSSMTGVAMGAISGNVSNTISQLPDSSEPDKPGIKEILTNLQTAIENDTNLSQEDKAEALEQVKKIAEAGKKPEEEGMQKITKNALTFLKGLTADLPSTAELVTTCASLIPVIKLFFGLP